MKILCAAGLLLASASAAFACDKTCLSDVTEQFLEVKVTGEIDKLSVASDLRATLNTKEVTLGEGESWETGITIVNRHTFLDPESNTSMFFGTMAGKWPEEEGLRTWWHYVLRLTTDEDGTIREVEEHVLADPIAADLPRPFREAPVFSQVLPEDERSDAATMIATANSYFDGITNGDGSNVMFGPDCQRTEKGTFRTNQNVESWNSAKYNVGLATSCRYRFTVRNKQFRWNIDNRRFYIADEARGVVVGIFHFNQHGDDGNPAITVPEALKIVNGRIQYKWAPSFDLSDSSGWADWDRLEELK